MSCDPNTVHLDAYDLGWRDSRDWTRQIVIAKTTYVRQVPLFDAETKVLEAWMYAAADDRRLFVWNM